mmetsp:Transcript_15971/g.37865  ORF Transcript_15971/g.37865 Transcript_15971/m.37865 type:complete len:246 (-) Transcript_15971:343-1080(-)
MADTMMLHADWMCSVDRAMTAWRLGKMPRRPGWGLAALRRATSQSARPSSRRLASSGFAGSVAELRMGSTTPYAEGDSGPSTLRSDWRATITCILSSEFPSEWPQTSGSSASTDGRKGFKDSPRRSTIRDMSPKALSSVSCSEAPRMKEASCWRHPGTWLRNGSSWKSQSSMRARRVSTAASLITVSWSASAASTTRYTSPRHAPILLTQQPAKRMARRRSGAAAGDVSEASGARALQNHDGKSM